MPKFHRQIAPKRHTSTSVLSYVGMKLFCSCAGFFGINFIMEIGKCDSHWHFILEKNLNLEQNGTQHLPLEKRKKRLLWLPTALEIPSPSSRRRILAISNRRRTFGKCWRLRPVCCLHFIFAQHPLGLRVLSSVRVSHQHPSSDSVWVIIRPNALSHRLTRQRVFHWAMYWHSTKSGSLGHLYPLLGSDLMLPTLPPPLLCLLLAQFYLFARRSIEYHFPSSSCCLYDTQAYCITVAFFKNCVLAQAVHTLLGSSCRAGPSWGLITRCAVEVNRKINAEGGAERKLNYLRVLFLMHHSVRIFETKCTTLSHSTQS